MDPPPKAGARIDTEFDMAKLALNDLVAEKDTTLIIDLFHQRQQVHDVILLGILLAADAALNSFHLFNEKGAWWLTVRGRCKK